ncbi:MAG: hypothetical protein A4E71_01464 [Smithella sp. PtaU1.Bin162]|nr:MAG: hypothetical protein A4E71_01464 [Smithella sp. PtaU1.Bin162]
MIEADIGNYRNKRPANIGCIQPPAQTNLQHGNVDSAALKVKKGRHSQYFKISYRFTNFLPDRGDNPAEIIYGNFFPVNSDSFPYIDQMRGCVKSGLVTGRMQY